MPDPASAAPISPLSSSGRVTQRTLTLIRWVAIVGQLTTTLTVRFGLGFTLPLGAVLATIAAATVLNLASMIQRRGRPQLADPDAAVYLGFDTLQLSVLLGLTGGLDNPFSVLLLAPLTVGATILSRVSVVALTGVTLLCLGSLAIYHLPLPWPGDGLTLPLLYAVGVWEALSLSTIFIAAYAWSVAHESRRIAEALTASQMSLARAQRLSALGALAAAAAHELGSPLGTIAVVAKEMARDVPSDSPLVEDLALLQSQTARCRDILAELARRPETEGGTPFDQLPLRAVIAEAAGPHQNDAIDFDIRVHPAPGVGEPTVRARPEILHGLGNLIQNALQFAARRVTVDVFWDEMQVMITIADDGPGFPPGVLARVGEPYLSTRVDPAGHMGLGIFIAQTLLEQTGAGVVFANHRGGGAEVVIRWPRLMLSAEPPAAES